MTYPQVLVNVRVKQKTDLDAGAGDRRRRCSKVEQGLAGNGRLLVRYSGTEPLLRIMLEGKDDAEIRALGGRDRGAVRREGSDR